jgi:hypothetical protein
MDRRQVLQVQNFWGLRQLLSPLIQHYRPAVPRQTAAGEQKATRYQTEASVRE